MGAPIPGTIPTENTPQTNDVVSSGASNTTSGGGQGVPDIDFDKLYKDVSEQNTGADIAENIPYVGTFVAKAMRSSSKQDAEMQAHVKARMEYAKKAMETDKAMSEGHFVEGSTVWTGGYNVSTKESAEPSSYVSDGSAPDPDFIEDIHLGGETEMGNEVSSGNGSGVMSLVKKYWFLSLIPLIWIVPSKPKKRK